MNAVGLGFRPNTFEYRNTVRLVRLVVSTSTTMRCSSLHSQLGLLAIGLVPHIQGVTGQSGSPFSQQQYLIGEFGPYGYSIADFRQALLRPIATAQDDATAVQITSSGSPIDGWRLSARAFDNVPFPEGNEKSMIFNTAALYLSPDDSSQRDNLRGWSLCSAVWTMGLSEAALSSAKASATGSSLGSCGGMLPDDCIAEMVGGFNSAGSCQNQTMPRSCAPFLSNGTDGVTSASNLPQSKFVWLAKRKNERAFADEEEQAGSESLSPAAWPAPTRTASTRLSTLR